MRRLRKLLGNRVSVALALTGVLSGCVLVDHDDEELLPTQFNHSDASGLNLVVMTQSTLVERDYSESRHRRVSKFPPHLILFFSADREFAGHDIVIVDAELRGPQGLARTLVPRGRALRLKTISEVPSGEYRDYTHLKHQGGDRLVRAVYFSEPLPEIVVGESYQLVLTYVSLDGSEVNLDIGYKARRHRAAVPLPYGKHLPPT